MLLLMLALLQEMKRSRRRLLLLPRREAALSTATAETHSPNCKILLLELLAPPPTKLKARGLSSIASDLAFQDGSTSRESDLAKSRLDPAAIAGGALTAVGSLAAVAGGMLGRLGAGNRQSVSQY